MADKELDTLLKQLRLPTFRDNYADLAQQAAKEDLSYTEYLLHLARAEAQIRRYNQIQRLVKASRLPLEKTFENFDFKKLPLGITQQVKVLSEGMFVDKCENILAFGRPGSGKTHLLCGICHELARQGNRPENLRWLTRLENALKNPATRKKIEYLCGSIEAFLENPSMLNELQGEPNFKWMRTVTPGEAKNCKQRMDIWVSKESRGSTGEINRKSSFGERVYKPLQKWEVGLDREPGLELSLTPWCAQYMWRAEAYFPSCPQDFGTDPLEDYFQNLKIGVVLYQLYLINALNCK